MNKIILFCGIVSVLLGACRTSNSSATDEIRTIHWPPAEQFPVQQLIDSVELISFEVSDSALFGFPVFLAYTPEKVFVIGNEGGAAIKVFDSRGKYLNQVGQKGRGPGEYLNVFGWNVVKDTLYIGDCMQNKLLTYQTDGKLLREMQIPERIREILGDKRTMGIVVTPLQEGYCITPVRGMLDKDLKQTACDFVITDLHFRVRDTLVKAAGHDDQEGYIALVNRKSGDTLTILNRRGQMLGRFYFDFGNDKITSQAEEQLTLKELLSSRTFIIRTLICGDLVFMDIRDKGRTTRWVFNWKKEQFYPNIESAGIYERILNHYAVCLEENSIISLISSPHSTGFEQLPEPLQTSLEEEGGAIMVKYRLRK